MGGKGFQEKKKLQKVKPIAHPRSSEKVTKSQKYGLLLC